MRIKFDCIAAGVPSPKTHRVYPEDTLRSIVKQLNEQSFFIINVVGDHSEPDFSRVCGSSIKGTALLQSGVVSVDVAFLDKNYFLAHPFDYTDEMKNMDMQTGNVMEKLTSLNMIDYSPIGTGEVNALFVKNKKQLIVTDYTLLYIFGQPRGL